MPDPFDALRAPDEPVDPDPTFTAQLRVRVQRSLSLPRGVTVSDLTDPVTSEAANAATSDPIRHGDVGYTSLWVPDETRARRFFSAVLGWPETGHRQAATPGGIDHGFAGGVERSTLMAAYAVDDIAETVERIVDAGGQAEAPTQEPWGLTAMATDPEGVRFAAFQLPATGRRPRPAANGVEAGDLAYITMEVGDSSVARRFYGDVLGWTFEPGHVEDGWGPVDTAPMTGMHGGHDRPRLVPMYRVEDIRAAVRRVEAAGGTATEPELQPYGWSAECTDDQETFFYLYQA